MLEEAEAAEELGRHPEGFHTSTPFSSRRGTSPSRWDFHGQLNHPEVQAAVADGVRRIRGRRPGAGRAHHRREDARRWLDLGAVFIYVALGEPAAAWRARLPCRNSNEVETRFVGPPTDCCSKECE